MTMLKREQFDLSVLPEEAQIELYDFYLFLKQRYQCVEPVQKKQERIKRLNSLKVESFTPITRDEIYE